MEILWFVNLKLLFEWYVFVCVFVCIFVSFVHSTGQKMESTATGPSRWSLSPPTWRRTSSAEYSGSTTPLGYGSTESVPNRRRRVLPPVVIATTRFPLDLYLTRPTRVPACPLTLCRLFLPFFNDTTAPVIGPRRDCPQIFQTAWSIFTCSSKGRNQSFTAICVNLLKVFFSPNFEEKHIFMWYQRWIVFF